MTIGEKIDTFLDVDSFGVVGASRKPHKYGNKVLRCYLQNRQTVIPVNPVEKEIEGLPCVASVSDDYHPAAGDGRGRRAGDCQGDQEPLDATGG